jgi:hypothetical protein
VRDEVLKKRSQKMEEIVDVVTRIEILENGLNFYAESYLVATQTGHSGVIAATILAKLHSGRRDETYVSGIKLDFNQVKHRLGEIAN